MDLISFDIDGTLETGNGPGPITLDMVRGALAMGYIIGSASDRPLGDQKNMWERAGIPVEFIINKHMLGDIKVKFEADQYIHIGDTDMDKHYATINGFAFIQVQTMDREPWMGEIPWGPQGRGTSSFNQQPSVAPSATAPTAATPPVTVPIVYRDDDPDMR